MSEGKRNPGWAGDTGEFDLTERQVRGVDYVGDQPAEGWDHGGVNAVPYQRAERDLEIGLFEGPYATRLRKILARYPNKRAALLPVLTLAQEIRGYLSQDAMEAVAAALDLEPATVRGVATFYTMYNKRPVGRHLIQVCTNVACNLCGGHEVFEAFLEHTGTEPGQISEDGEFTVIEAECLGACGFPTVVQINNRYFEDVEAGDVPDLLARLRERGVDPTANGASRGGGSAGPAAGARGGASGSDRTSATKPGQGGEED
ncbi:MAG: NAD(P)H-dependent oxidoreductase subunit E [Gemmatimonadota bacterium]